MKNEVTGISKVTDFLTKLFCYCYKTNFLLIGNLKYHTLKIEKFSELIVLKISRKGFKTYLISF